MGRGTVDAAINTPAARGRLTPRAKPYYRALEPGVHLGYRKNRGRPGTWLARYYIGEQQYQVEAITHQTTFGTAPCTADDASPADGVRTLNYAQAIERARARAAERANEAAGLAIPATVAGALDVYLDWLEAHGKSGNDTRASARVHIYEPLGGVKLEELTTEQLHRWLVALAQAPARKRNGVKEHDTSDKEAVRKRRASANRILTILKAALNHAFRDGKVASDAAWRKLRPFRDVERARVRFLTVDEALRLIAACDGQFRPLAQAALTTGARYGELRALLVEDFNAAGGTVHVRQSKSGKARHIVLNAEGAAFFAGLCAGRAGHELMFRHADGQTWRRSNQQHRMAAACERAGIVPPIGFHGLRHTWASLSVMAGMPLPVVARNLGHASIEMVSKHYGHLSPDYIAQAVRAGAPTFGWAS
jgi:integrase